MRQLISAVIAAIFLASSLHGSDAISRETIREGLEDVYSLNYANAWDLFDRLRIEHPESPVGYGMLALTAYNKLLFDSRNLAVFRYGMPSPFDDLRPPAELVENKEKGFLDANETLLNFCKKQLEKNPEDSLALYFKGMAYENMAMYALTFYGKKTEAATFATTAGNIHKEVLKRDPDLVYAETSIAVPEYVVGSLPFGIRWLGLLMGIHGDKKDAMQKLEEVADKGLYRAADSLLVMALLNAWKGDGRVAVSLFRRIRAQYPRNFLLDIGLAVAYEEAVNDPSSAIRVYLELLGDLSSKAPGIEPGEIYFRIGKCYAELQDYRRALDYFQKALSSSRSAAETEPLVYYGMARIYEKLGDKKQATDCYRLVAGFSGPKQLIQKQVDQARKKIH